MPMRPHTGQTVTCQPGAKGTARSSEVHRNTNASAMRRVPIAIVMRVDCHYTPVKTFRMFQLFRVW